MIRTPIRPPLRGLVSAHPEPEAMLAAIHHANSAELAAIGRLWLTEGIPAAFAACPLEYEHIRTLIADDLEISPRAVNMVGSARIGFSLAPRKFPRKLLAGSDLDIFIVDAGLFERCMQAFERWCEDVRSGKRKPTTEEEARRWERMLPRLPERRSYGFCDPRHLHAGYPPIGDILGTMRRAKRALKQLGQERDVSARVYRDWERVQRKILRDLRDVRLKHPLPNSAGGEGRRADNA